MKHRSITLTDTQEKAFKVASEAHNRKVHFLWYPHDSGVEMDEFMEDAGKIEEGEWLMQSWSGALGGKHIPIWERIGLSEDDKLGKSCWKPVGYYDWGTGDLVLK